jgi:hypothetical protein
VTRTPFQAQIDGNAESSAADHITVQMSPFLSLVGDYVCPGLSIVRTVSPSRHATSALSRDRTFHRSPTGHHIVVDVAPTQVVAETGTQAHRDLTRTVD